MKLEISDLNQAISELNRNSQKIVLRHVIAPVIEQEITQIKKNGCFNASKNALGGQSDGYYFFTTKQGSDNHIKDMQPSWDTNNGKQAYLVECEVDLDEAKYPTWKLDYEAMQDFLFDMIYDAAREQNIKFDDVEISAQDKKILSILKKGRFSRIKSFCPSEHSGLVERASDFLYKHNKNFKKSYDDLMRNVFLGNGNNLELYAVKTQAKPKITKITQIKPQEKPKTTVSQIDKFLARYGGKKA